MGEEGGRKAGQRKGTRRGEEWRWGVCETLLVWHPTDYVFMMEDVLEGQGEISGLC